MSSMSGSDNGPCSKFNIGLCHTVQAVLQGIKDATTEHGRWQHNLKMLTPALLREALRSAGNIILADEVDEVLSYVISDGCCDDLCGLCLLRMQDGTVEQILDPSASSVNEQEQPKLAPSLKPSTICFLIPAITRLWRTVQHGETLLGMLSLAYSCTCMMCTHVQAIP